MGAPLKAAAQAAAVAAVIGLLALLVWRVTHQNDGAGFLAAVDQGHRPAAPQFTLPRLAGGGSLSLASFRGKPVVIDFWASWCYACPYESRRLEAALRRYGSKIAFLGVDTKDFGPDAKRWQRQYGITYPSVHDGSGSVFQRWGGLPLPREFFVDRHGRVIGQLVVEEDLPRYLRQLVTS